MKAQSHDMALLMLYNPDVFIYLRTHNKTHNVPVLPVYY